MKVKIIDITPTGNSLEVRLQFLDANSVFLAERKFQIPYKQGFTLAAGKAWLKDRINDFKAEQDTNTRVAGFKGQTFDESQL